MSLGSVKPTAFFPVDPEATPTDERKLSLTDRAYALIRKDIVICVLEPGMFFTEAELSERLKMSKTPIREALLRLQVERMVSAIPRRGYEVTPLHVADIQDVFEHRRIIEGACAELAAIRIEPGDIEELRTYADMTAAHYDAIDGSDREAVSRHAHLNNVFHETIARTARNHRLHRTAVQAIRDYDRFFFLEWNAPAAYAPDYVDHHEILMHIVNRDPESAKLAMYKHVDFSRKSLLTGLAATGNASLLNRVRL
ncbi:transcriptional regulator, GntR family [Celeribacter indicus]|nr:transcriptional regulator, GntR family [Celeribacter indicus]